MKFPKYFRIIILAATVAAVGSVLSASSPRTAAAAAQGSADVVHKKRALLVGISKYCPAIPKNANCSQFGPYWWNLNTSAEVEGIAAVLSDPNGQYKFDEVKILKDGEATHANIVAAFRKFLIDQTQSGDIAYFHYSGHGGQAADDTAHGPNPKVGDEIDGWDETLIPSDYKKGKDGSNDIRDDEIGQLIADLEARHPANLTLTFDSCFSGTIQRGGDSIVRGARGAGTAPTTRGPNAVADGPSGLTDGAAPAGSGYVLMSATRNDQLANETKDPDSGVHYGAFSFALIKALKAAGEDTTYRDIFQKVSDDVSRNQHDQNPQLEGDLDKKLMSGIVRKQVPYTSVTVTPGTADVVLKAGRLMGVSKGSEYSIYAVGTEASGKPIAKATVTVVKDIVSGLKIEPAPNEALIEKLKTARGIETKHDLGDMRLKVSGIDKLPADAQTALKNMDLLVAVPADTNAAVRICKARCSDELPNTIAEPQGDFVTLQRMAGGSVAARLPTSDAARMQEILEGEARRAYFGSLKDGGDASLADKVKIRLVPVKPTAFENGFVSSEQDLAPQAPTTAGGAIEARPCVRNAGRCDPNTGDYFMLEVANLSEKPVWVTVIDIAPDGQITPLFPSPKIPIGQSSENKFPAAKFDASGNPLYTRVKLPYVIHITPPSGNEVLRVIATTDEADFSPLFSEASRGSLARGTAGERGGKEAKTPFGQLLISGARTQGARGRGEIPGAANIADATVESPALTMFGINLIVLPK
jgi:metacaspase-1